MTSETGLTDFTCEWHHLFLRFFWCTHMRAKLLFILKTKRHTSFWWEQDKSQKSIFGWTQVERMPGTFGQSYVELGAWISHGPRAQVYRGEILLFHLTHRACLQHIIHVDCSRLSVAGFEFNKRVCVGKSQQDFLRPGRREALKSWNGFLWDSKCVRLFVWDASEGP